MLVLFFILIIYFVIESFIDEVLHASTIDSYFTLAQNRLPFFPIFTINIFTINSIATIFQLQFIDCLKLSLRFHASQSLISQCESTTCHHLRNDILIDNIIFHEFCRTPFLFVFYCLLVIKLQERIAYHHETSSFGNTQPASSFSIITYTENAKLHLFNFSSIAYNYL